MNIHDLREAQVRYEDKMEDILKDRKHLYKIQSEFTKKFNVDRISSMQIDDYVLGANSINKKLNFCYTLERSLDGLGRVTGATAFKFGIYYGQTSSDKVDKYRFTKKFGNDYKSAFEGVRLAILELLAAGKKEDITAIAKNIFSPMIKGKILSTYFPNRYLHVFSDEHLDFFLIKLDLDNADLNNANPVYKREALIEFKNADSIMRNWSLDLFADFLYTEYPGRPPKLGNTKNYNSYLFPKNQIASFIQMEILSPNMQKNEITSYVNTNKIDYEKKGRQLKLLGDRGEKIVMDSEVKALTEAGRKDLARKVKRVSLESDSFGYDILSFEISGKKKFIEVKATRSKVGPANFFFTANELSKSKKLDNYFIYMVYDVTSESPKIWQIKNPFNPENKNILKTPINYQIIINASKV